MKSKLSILNYTENIRIFINKHIVTIFLVVACSLLSIIILDIARKADAEPSQSQKDDAKKSVKVITFKKESIEVINDLRDQSVTIDTLFDPDRVDPFND